MKRKTLQEAKEAHVLRLLAKYKTQKEAAKVLGISSRTIRNIITAQSVR